MAAKIYTITQEQMNAGNDKKIVLNINGEDKLFTINSRMSNHDKITASLNSGDVRKALKLALGEKAAKEIDALDLSVEGYMNIIKTIEAAIGGIDPEKLDEFFRSNQI